MQHISKYRDKPGLFAKVDYYRKHASEYNLIFVGDSRTYCGMAPDVLDPMLHTHSINLSSFANWFPTQYSNLEDLLQHTPEGTIVVWSIGHQNFQRVGDAVKLVYPIGLRNVPRYLGWGYTWSSLSENVLDELPGFKVFVWRHTLRERVDRLFGKAVFSQPCCGPQAGTSHSLDRDPNGMPGLTLDASDDHGAPQASALIEVYRSDPNVIYVEPLYENGSITSLALYKRAGNYVRVELRPEFFREKQRELAEELKPLAAEEFVPDREYWQNFMGIVELFSKYKIRLIVNEFEEAPYHYDIPKNRFLYRSFMTKIRYFFESRGIPYVRVDFERLTNEDYFDYNHLNSRGIEQFSKMFADRVRPVLGILESRDDVQ
jgi:hypothetical protein